MLEKFRYINHLNEFFDFGKNNVFVNGNDLRDFAWEIESRNNRILRFKRWIVDKTIPIVIKCETAEEGLEIRNKIFELCEKDVLATKHGKIIIGDYFMKCYVTESSKSEYLKHGSYMLLNIKVSTDFPFWCKEHSTTFGYGKGSEGKNLDFKRDFPSDYTSNMLGKQLLNTALCDTNFIINVYGPCIEPEIIVGGHSYCVNVLIEKNEYLTIDSQTKTIVLTHEDGTKENCFKYRNRDSYIFTKMRPGTLRVSSNGNYKFEIILLEERSEPPWT